MLVCGLSGFSKCALQRQAAVLTLLRYTNLRVPRRHVNTHSRNLLSSVWSPAGDSQIGTPSHVDPLSLLERAGFLRQAYSGIFHFLPLGLRVLGKLDGLIEKYMNAMGASKVSLSSLSSEVLWQRSGRLQEYGSELFRLERRKAFGFVLAPTHEEEITELVGKSVQSYKQLPVRLYQISRKYRDERRPRGGLLRAKEFIMKDLYTFDASPDEASHTYDLIRQAYNGIFEELKIPYMVADADSGAMGGNLSHEYHYSSPLGEDNIISCEECSYVANEEKVEMLTVPLETNTVSSFKTWTAVADEGQSLVNVFFPVTSEINVHAVKVLVPSIDASLQDPIAAWTTKVDAPRRIINVFDHSLKLALVSNIRGRADDRTPSHLREIYAEGIPIVEIVASTDSGRPLEIVRVKNGDSCPRCLHGKLKSELAIELAHTFYLGARYSIPLGAYVDGPGTSGIGKDRVPIQMNCAGIGTTRLVGAIASKMSDQRGLRWPRVIAPFDVVVVSTKPSFENGAADVYDSLALGGALDPVLDDRRLDFAWKMKDADLVGYPVIVVIGRAWQTSQECEVQCRSLGIRQDIHIASLTDFITSLLRKL